MTPYIIFTIYLSAALWFDCWYQNRKIKSLLEIFLRVRRVGNYYELKDLTDQIEGWLDSQGKRMGDV